jgi:multiple sugar transport system ATP-binding protein
MPEVALEGIVKTYANGVRAVDDLHLTIREGELLVLVGPSGCGKTTTLRLLAGLETPTRGVIRMGGQVVNSWPPRRRDVGMVFQRPALYPHRTVADNLAFSLALRQPGWWRQQLLRLVWPQRYRQVRREAAALAARVDETARLLCLEGVLKRSPAELSGGQQQRVALGRALVRRPGLFLLDEPLSNLDAGLRLELRRELHLLHRRFPATMVYVTHDPVEALNLGDRVAVLQDGRLQQVDRPQGLYEHPGNRFVAGFIGWPPMNFLDGQLVRADGRLTFTAPGWKVWLPPGKAALEMLADGRRLTLGVRPDHVTWQAIAAQESLPMEVTLVETLGSNVLVTFTAQGQQMAVVGREGMIEEGQKVMVRFEASQVHLFDSATGLALGTG